MRKHQLIRLASTWIAFMPALSFGATKIFLRDASSVLGTTAIASTPYGCGSQTTSVYNTYDVAYRQANTTQGSSTVTRTFDPSTVAPPCWFQTQTASGGQFLIWASPPLSAAVTISGNINYSAGCAESSNALNGGIRFIVLRWSAATGGISSTVHTSAASAECGTTAALVTIASAAPTSTAFKIGDRIIIKAELTDGSGVTFSGNAGRTISLLYDGAAASTGDTFVNFADAISFSADSAAVPSSVR